MLTNQLKELSPNRAIVLDNVTCVYCGNDLIPGEDTEDHVIGRRFVPKGKLDGQWNLIVRACQACNGAKGDLEDDISAITMQPDAWGIHADGDALLVQEANRKGKSFSRLTGKPVANSQGEVKICMPLAQGVAANFSFTSPPQIEQTRIYQLAFFQVRAFFYFITFDKGTKKGGFWPEGLYPISYAQRHDWGNALHMAFMQSVVHWELRVIGNSADGFFKSIIRRHPDAPCWAWALEWNKNYRVIGFFGEFEAAKRIVDTLPRLEAKSISLGERRCIAFRNETPLKEDEDLLFSWDVTE